MTNEIGSSTLVACGFKLGKREQVASEQGPRTPFTPVSGTASSSVSLDALVQDEIQMKDEITAVKTAVAEEKDLNAKRHDALLAAIAALAVNFPSPPP